MVYGTTLRLPDEFFLAVQPEPQVPDSSSRSEEVNVVNSTCSRHRSFQTTYFRSRKATEFFTRVSPCRFLAKTAPALRYDGPFAILEHNEMN